MDEVREAAFKENLVEIFKGMDLKLVKGAFAGAKFPELFFGRCKDEELAAYIRGILA